ncbi:multivesicular body subunit 12Bb isoform X3 [Notolabrus celidotus]|uniref:multivesicular body subunit 12Bb isoform X3 n=1 Tax=Notolabrus celidotus TaxID=1203425 RepID=UPI00148FC46A|nr:multivesicular body subunit 12Bb isoform X3 [Notolabrus celidotus]
MYPEVIITGRSLHAIGVKSKVGKIISLRRPTLLTSFNMSEVTDQYFTEPITAVGVICSPNKAPDDYYVVAQTTDGSDADLWKDGLFKSKVTRYLCFTRKTGPEVVVDMKLIDIKDVLPEGFTPVEETMDTKETAMRKRRMCVKMSPRAAAEKAVNDIKITAKSKNHLVNYTCMGDINNMGLWYGVGVASQQQSTQQTSSRANSDAPPGTIRRTTNRPTYEHQGSGTYTMTALDDVPFVISEKFGERRFKEMQQVNLMGITIKSLAEIEEEFYYNFTTERSIAV